MPLETATYISQLVDTNPADTDSEGQGSAHLRLIKEALLATLPNFTAAALNSTQAEIDAAVTATSTGAFKLGAGTVGAPALALASDATTGVWSAGTGKIDISIAGVQLLELNSAGLNLTAGTLQFSGVDVFPLQAPAYGALSIPIGAYAAASVLYADIQNVAADKLLGNPTGSAAAPSEIALGAGLTFSGSTLVGTATLGAVSNDLLIVNDSTNPNTQVNITCSEAVMTNYAGGSQYGSSVSVSVVTTATGVNGMGTVTGTRTTNAQYYWWLIGNGTLVKALGSTQSTYAGLVSSGDLPSGYTFAKRVGAGRTNGSSNLLQQRQSGKDVQFTSMQNLASLSGGGITTWTAISLSSFVPPTANKVTVSVTNSGSVGGATMGVAPNTGYTLAAGGCPLYLAGGEALTGIATFVIEVANTIYWAAGSSGGSSALVDLFQYSDTI